MSTTAQITSLNIETYGNAITMRANIMELDLMQTRFDAEIGLGASLIPTTDNTFFIGNAAFGLNDLHTANCSVDVLANVNELIIDTMVFRNNTTGNINYTGNLVPTTDDVYALGFTGKRWKRIVVGDLLVDNIIASGIITGNLDVTINSNLIDNTTIISDDIDNTKQFRFQAEQITTGTMREYVVPDGDTTLVGNDYAQTITNKTITGNTNVVEAHWLATNLGGNVVTIDTANPPIAGQVLSAITSTSAAWLNPSQVVSGSAVTDNQFESNSIPHVIPMSQTVFVDIPAMIMTTSVPGIDASYLMLFNATVSASNNSTSFDFAFAIDGTTVSGTVIRITPETKERNVTVFFTLDGVFDTQIITSQWRVASGSGSGVISFRSMALLGFGTQ